MYADGFTSDFGKLISSDGVYAYILKGGAGTGKSTLMKKIASELSDRCDVDCYFCSSDPASLDAVYVRQANALVVDGTAPHTFDPEFPAVKQRIVNLGEHWDNDALKADAEAVIGVTVRHRGLMDRAKSYVSAVTRLADNTYSAAEEELDRERVEALAVKKAQELLPDSGKPGSVDMRLLGAVTPEGYLVQTDTVNACEKVIVLTDEYYAASDAFLKKLAEEAEKRGCSVTVSKCNLLCRSVYEFVIIEDAGIAFAASTPINGFKAEGAQKLNLTRLYNKGGLTLKRQRLRMNRSACSKLLEEAVQTLKDAKAVHDEIERYYVAVMDFGKVTAEADSIICEMKKAIKSED